MAVYIPEINRQPQLFLSHSSVDKKFVRRLAKDLSACEVDVWLDEWEIEPGDSISKQVGVGLSLCKYVAVIMSKSSVTSRWVDEELELAITRQLDSGVKVVIPILLETVSIPPLLRGKLYLSFVEDYYQSLFKLACIIHDVPKRTAWDAIESVELSALHGVIKALKYCDVDTAMIVPKDVFEEFVLNLKVYLNDENGLRFLEEFVNQRGELKSERAKYYYDRYRESRGLSGFK